MIPYVLHPDVQFPLPADLEAQVYGADFEVLAYMPHQTASISS